MLFFCLHSTLGIAAAAQFSPGTKGELSRAGSQSWQVTDGFAVALFSTRQRYGAPVNALSRLPTSSHGGSGDLIKERGAQMGPGLCLRAYLRRRERQLRATHGLAWVPQAFSVVTQVLLAVTT